MGRSGNVGIGRLGDDATDLVRSVLQTRGVPRGTEVLEVAHAASCECQQGMRFAVVHALSSFREYRLQSLSDRHTPSTEHDSSAEAITRIADRIREMGQNSNDVLISVASALAQAGDDATAGQIIDFVARELVRSGR